MSSEEKQELAAVTCSIMGETRNMDAAVRVEKINEARKELGGEPFLRGDSTIQEAFKWGLCVELVLNEDYDETLQTLKDEQRIADGKPTVKETFHPNGKLKSRTTHHSKIDGALERGPYEVYYENGQLSYKGNYRNGKPHGLRESYYENGQLSYIANLKDGKLYGPRERYYENGQLIYKENYKDGKRHGLRESYYENGKLLVSACWKKGEETDMSYCEQ